MNAFSRFEILQKPILRGATNMAEDKELVAMATILSALEPLDGDERHRVLSWVGQRLSVKSPTPNSTTATQETAQTSNIELSTDTIATVLAAKSGPDIIMAAAAHLHFVQRLQKFSRQQLTAEMRTAPAHFKETFVNNLSKYLAGLTRSDRLRLVASDTYALSSAERQQLETKLLNAA